MKIRPIIFCFPAFLFPLSGFFSVTSVAATVWNGPAISFTMDAGGDWTQPANQDHLTPNIWLTRATSQGLFNAASEGAYTHNVSPADTEWAVGELTNYASLTYSSWETCYGGSHQLAGNITSEDVVVHLEGDDIYLALRFTFWGGSGGGFSYTRSTAPVSSSVTLTNPAVSGTNFLFSFVATAGHTHTVESRTNLLTGSWQTRTNIIGDDSLKTVRFPKRPDVPEFFHVLTN